MKIFSVSVTKCQCSYVFWINTIRRKSVLNNNMLGVRNRDDQIIFLFKVCMPIKIGFISSQMSYFLCKSNGLRNHTKSIDFCFVLFF